MLADRDLQPGARAARKQDHAQQADRAEQEAGLHHRAPAAADIAQVVADRAHRQQVDRRAEQRGRMEHHAARHGERGVPGLAARHRGGHQRHGQRVDHAARGPQVGVQLAEQHGVAVHIKIVGEHAADAEAGELDRPALFDGLVAVHLLDQQHAVHGQPDEHRQHRHAAVGEQDPGHLQAGQEDAQQQHVDGAGGLQRGAWAAVGVAPVAQQGHQEQRPGAVAQQLERAVQAGPDALVQRAPGQHAGPQGTEQAGQRQRDALVLAAPARQDRQAQHQEAESGQRITGSGDIDHVRRRDRVNAAAAVIEPRPRTTISVRCGTGRPSGCRSGSARRGTGCCSSRSTGRTAAFAARPRPTSRSRSAPAPSR
jgi:hypothetical protein